MELSIPGTWEEAEESLLPVLRPVTQPASAAPIRRGIAPLLHSLVAMDLPEVRVFVTPEHLARWRAPADLAFAQAAANLPAGTGLVRRPDGLWELDSDDGYEASRLVLPGFLAAFEGRVNGRPVAVAPHARRLLIAGSAEIDQLWAILELAAREWRAEGDPVSPVAYVADARGALAPWQPPKEAPEALRASVGASIRALAQREHARHREVLATRGVEVAAYEVAMAAERDVPSPYAFTRWTRGSTALLPEVDVVVLTDPAIGPLLAVPAEAVWRIAGAHLERLPETVPLLRARSWPDPSMLAALQKEALSPDHLG